MSMGVSEGRRAGLSGNPRLLKSLRSDWRDSSVRNIVKWSEERLEEESFSDSWSTLRARMVKDNMPQQRQ
jgi:hypothetical protein